MSERRRRGTPVRRLVGALAVGLLLVAPLTLLLLAVETAPGIPDRDPPDAAAAARTRDVAARAKALFDEAGTAAPEWSVTEAEINAVFAAARRVAPGLHGRARVEPDAVRIAVSAGAPYMPAGLWANVELAFAVSESGLEVASARIGRLPLPPALAARALALALDRALGDGLGAAAIGSVAALRVAPPVATVALSFGEGERAALSDRLRARVLAALGTTARERVYGQLGAMQKGVGRQRLPRDGSMLPYLRQALRFGNRRVDGDDREEARAALYALALYCGDPEFGRTIQVTLPGRMDGARNGCAGTTLAGRDDLKRHFVISAGLYAATTGRAAFGMGELKELLDSNAGGSGFSFDDIAADAAGLKFAERLMATPRARWPELLDRIASEADLLPSLEGLPGGLSEAEFRARYGDVDSPAYAAVVAEIERRVAALPLHVEAIAN